jgi:hypothetical protein
MRRRTMLKKCFRSDVRRSRVCERNKLSCSCEPNTLPFRETSPANRRLATDTWNRLFATRTSLSISSFFCFVFVVFFIFLPLYMLSLSLHPSAPWVLYSFFIYFVIFYSTISEFSEFVSVFPLSLVYLLFPFHICTYINDVLNSFPLLLLFGFLSL